MINLIAFEGYDKMGTSGDKPSPRVECEEEDGKGFNEMQCRWFMDTRGHENTFFVHAWGNF